MPDILWGKGAHKRENGDFTELKCVNLFAEAAPTTSEGVALLSRKGMSEIANLAASPVIGQYQRPNLFSGDPFRLLANNQLYRGTTLIGSISGTGPVTWAASDIELILTRGGTAYSYNGTNLQAIVFPDSANVTAVTGTIGGRFIYARANSHQYYWSNVFDGRTIGGSAFSSAESAPDHIRDVLAIGDNLYLLGAETVETHMLTTSNTLPFTRISQRAFRKGVISTGCAVEMDNALHWISNDFKVYRMADTPQIISHQAMVERISQSASWSAFSFGYDGHEFLAVRLDNGTWLHDPAVPGQWPEFQTYGLANWIARCAITVDGVPQFGSSQDGKIYQFSGWQDDGEVIERRFTAAFPIAGGSVPVDCIAVECNSGAASGSANPQLEMRQSRDGGKTFSTWRTASLGATGEYRKRPDYRRCGYFDAPGAVFEFRCMDDRGLRVSRVPINEPQGGRSR